MAPAKSLHVGIFIPSDTGAQLFDTACVDIFGILSKAYLTWLEDLVPSHLIGLAPDITFSYIGGDAVIRARRATSKNGDDDDGSSNGTTTTTTNNNSSSSNKAFVILTAGMKIELTHHFSDDEVRPGKLDIVLVPGPDPREAWAPDALAWLKAQGENEGTDILSVCTGIFLCGEAGLLAGGRTACGPRGMQGDLKKRFKGCHLVGEKLRWVRDGNFWSSGGFFSFSFSFSLPLIPSSPPSSTLPFFFFFSFFPFPL